MTNFLADAGTDKSHILSVTIYLKDIEKDYAAFNEVWDAWVADIDALPRTCVEAKLYDPRVLVELTVVAVKPVKYIINKNMNFSCFYDER